MIKALDILNKQKNDEIARLQHENEWLKNELEMLRESSDGPDAYEASGPLESRDGSFTGSPPPSTCGSEPSVPESPVGGAEAADSSSESGYQSSVASDSTDTSGGGEAAKERVAPLDTNGQPGGGSTVPTNLVSHLRKAGGVPLEAITELVAPFDPTFELDPKRRAMTARGGVRNNNSVSEQLAFPARRWPI